MYRVRIVFNAPVDRAHPFYGVPHRTLDGVLQELDDLRPVIIHAVSVTLQQDIRLFDEPVPRWETISPSRLMDLQSQWKQHQDA